MTAPATLESLARDLDTLRGHREMHQSAGASPDLLACLDVALSHTEARLAAFPTAFPFVGVAPLGCDGYCESRESCRCSPSLAWEDAEALISGYEDDRPTGDN